MNEHHIEKLYERVESKSEYINDHLWYVYPEVLRTALTSAYNMGLQKAVEMADEVASDPPTEETHGFIEGCHAVIAAIEKGKVESSPE